MPPSGSEQYCPMSPCSTRLRYFLAHLDTPNLRMIFGWRLGPHRGCACHRWFSRCAARVAVSVASCDSAGKRGARGGVELGHPAACWGDQHVHRRRRQVLDQAVPMVGQIATGHRRPATGLGRQKFVDGVDQAVPVVVGEVPESARSADSRVGMHGTPFLACLGNDIAIVGRPVREAFTRCVRPWPSS
jgi:hypothetical protein